MSRHPAKKSQSSRRFLVQEHQASHHHYDFRLEMGGVLKSWAIPKGPSMKAGQWRLAIEVPDHSLSYFGYEGIIPKGSYGAGPVIVWDEGTYRSLGGEDPLDQLAAGHLQFQLSGKKLKGAFTIHRMKGREREWLLIKKRDDYAESDWETVSELTASRLRRLKVKAPPCEAH